MYKENQTALGSVICLKGGKKKRSAETLQKEFLVYLSFSYPQEEEKGS